MKKLYALIAVGIVATSIVGVLLNAPFARAQEVKGPYIDKITFKLEKDKSKAAKLIEKGEELQAYLAPLEKVADKKFAKESPDIKVVPGYGNINNLFLNPVQWGHFNPFAIRKVREAMNWLIDREYIVEEIYGGFAVPMYTTYHPKSPDYARNAAYMARLEEEYSHNPEKAERVIEKALREEGCTKVNGKWYYENEPIKVTVEIRTEDLRKDIGEYVAGLLEGVGFKVKRDYLTFKKAYPKVFNSIEGWNVYTGGWAFTAITPYADDWVHYFYRAEWSGKVFKEYTPAPRLVELAEKLRKGEYGENLELREEWVKESARLMLEDSTRVWLLVGEAVFPYHKSVSKVTRGIWAGGWHLFSQRTARINGEVGGSLKVGLPSIMVSSFNPIGGLKGVYDSQAGRLINDYGVYPHPHTGRYIPLRSDFKVETAGPQENLPVPEDTLKYNVENEKFSKVGAGTVATSKVTFDLHLGKWHSGADINMNDVLASIAETFKVASPESPLHDPPSTTPAMRTFVEKFKGVRVVDENTVEVYTDYFHPDKSFIANHADVWPVLPWEVNALMNRCVLDKEAAFSDTTSKNWGVPWLDLAKGPSISVLEEKFSTLKEESFIPKCLRGRVSSEEAEERWSALEEWHEKVGHFYVGNGPYYLDEANPDAMTITLKAFRKGYPFGPGHWEKLTELTIPEIEITEVPTIVPGEKAEFKAEATYKGEPYGKVEIDYSIIRPASGEIVKKGEAEAGAPGKFSISLSGKETSRLEPGTYKLKLSALGEEASLPKFTSETFEVEPQIMKFKELLRTAEEELRGDIKSLEGEIESVKEEIKEVRSETEEIPAITYVALVIAAIGFVLGGISLYRTR